MVEGQISTGDVIFLESVSDDTAALGQERYVHAEGFVDTRVGIAGKAYATRRGNAFRECLFEVTAQLKYGAQKELEDHSRKFLTAIYESMREIKEQLDLLEYLLQGAEPDGHRAHHFRSLQAKLEKQVPRHAVRDGRVAPLQRVA
jgi:hypothetical protein